MTGILQMLVLAGIVIYVINSGLLDKLKASFSTTTDTATKTKDDHVTATADDTTGKPPAGDKTTGDKTTGDKTTGDKTAGDKTAGDKTAGGGGTDTGGGGAIAPRVSWPKALLKAAFDRNHDGVLNDAEYQYFYNAWKKGQVLPEMGFVPNETEMQIISVIYSESQQQTPSDTTGNLGNNNTGGSNDTGNQTATDKTLTLAQLIRLYDKSGNGVIDEIEILTAIGQWTLSETVQGLGRPLKDEEILTLIVEWTRLNP